MVYYSLGIGIPQLAVAKGTTRKGRYSLDGTAEIEEVDSMKTGNIVQASVRTKSPQSRLNATMSTTTPIRVPRTIPTCISQLELIELKEPRERR